jgi:hypothetical protein
MGYLAELRRAPSGDAIGYKVARRGDVNGNGQPVFYSGSELAADLSLPELLQRWAQAGLVEPAVGKAGDVVDRARNALRNGEEPGDGIIHATGDLLGALSGVTLTASDDRWVRATGAYDRAARPPGGRFRETGPVGGELRMLARRMLLVRGPAAREAVGSAALAVAVAALLQEVGAWQRRRGRLHQSAAAATARGCIHGGQGRSVNLRGVEPARGNDRERWAARSPGP